MIKHFKRYIKRLTRLIKRNEMQILPGQIAFFLVLSLIPIISLVGFIASSFQIDIHVISDGLNNTLPNEIIGIILPALNSPSVLTGISLLFGFFIASNGTDSIIIASNVLYRINEETYLKRRIKAMIMFLILIMLFLFMLIVFAFGDSILKFLLNLIFDEIPTFIVFITLILKWTFGLFGAFFMIKMIFTTAPNSPIPSKYMNKGAIFTTLAWIFTTLIYSEYVKNIANYNLFYGSLSNIVILMFWIYILSYTLVIGIAINSDNYLTSKED